MIRDYGNREFINSSLIKEFQGSGVFFEDLYTHVILEIILIVPTILGNILILMSIAKFPTLRSRSNILIANLAIADLFVGGILIPFDIANIFCHVVTSNTWYCVLELSLYVCLLGASVLNNFVMSLERFTVICCPLWYARRFTRRILYLIVVIIWIIIVTVSSLPLFGLKQTWSFPMPCTPKFIYTKCYHLVIHGLLVVTLLASFIMYGCVMKTTLCQLKKTMTSVENKRIQKYAKRTWLMMIVFGLFVICWAPYVVIVITSTFYHSTNLERARNWATLLGLLNSTMDWVVYGLINRRFRKAFTCILTCRCDINFSRLAATDPYIKDSRKTTILRHTIRRTIRRTKSKETVSS